MNLPSFITKLLCFWKGLSDRVASCSHRRLGPQAYGAESNDAKVNYPKSSQLHLWPAKGCSCCLGQQFSRSGWRVETDCRMGEVSPQISTKLGVEKKKRFM